MEEPAVPEDRGADGDQDGGLGGVRRGGRGAAHYVVVTDECLLMCNAVCLAQGTQRARRRHVLQTQYDFNE